MLLSLSEESDGFFLAFCPSYAQPLSLCFLSSTHIGSSVASGTDRFFCMQFMDGFSGYSLAMDIEERELGAGVTSNPEPFASGLELAWSLLFHAWV